jgi:hypothetical protein
MLNFIKRLFGRGSSKSQIEQMMLQVQQMKADLGTDLPIAELRPVLIPSSIFSRGSWVGPYHYFENIPVSLTWAYMRPNDTMQYLTTAKADELTAAGVEWKREARTRLEAEAMAKPWQMRRDKQTDRVMLALLQDEIGVSRLLCLDTLLDMFPDGFEFYVPNRYCSIVVSPHASDQDQADVKRLVQESLKFDVAMSDQPHSHKLLVSYLTEARYWQPKAGGIETKRGSI